MIHIEWTNIKGQKNYSVTIKANDPIPGITQTINYYSKNNWINIDMSKYKRGEFMKISVGALNNKTNKYEYNNSIDTYLE